MIVQWIPIPKIMIASQNLIWHKTFQEESSCSFSYSCSFILLIILILLLILCLIVQSKTFTVSCIFVQSSIGLKMTLDLVIDLNCCRPPSKGRQALLGTWVSCPIIPPLLPNSRFPLTSQSNKRNLERLYIWVVVVVVVVRTGRLGTRTNMSATEVE